MQFRCNGESCRIYIGGGPKGEGGPEYISILLGMRPDAPASTNTIRAFVPQSPPTSSLMENLLERSPPGNPFSFGKYLREKLKFDSGRSYELRRTIEVYSICSYVVFEA